MYLVSLRHPAVYPITEPVACSCLVSPYKPPVLAMQGGSTEQEDPPSSPTSVLREENLAAQRVSQAWADVAAGHALPAVEAPEEMQVQSLFTSDDGPEPPRKRGRPKQARVSAAAAASVGSSLPSSQTSGQAVTGAGTPTARASGGPPPEAVRLVAVDLKGALMPAAKKGRLVQAPLHEAMLQGQKLAECDDANLDEGVLALASFYLDVKNYHLTSAAALQDRLRLDSAGLQSRLRRLAATVVLQQLHERWTLERVIASSLPSGSLLLYLDVVAYDETPMKLGIQTLDRSEQPSASMPEAYFGGSSSGRPKAEASIVKLLQTKANYAMLLEIPGEKLAILGPHYSPLQSMPRTTGEALRDCLLLSTGVSLDADKFRLKCRTVACDRAGYNKRGEQLLAQDRGGWCTSVFHCDIHALANSFTKTFEGLASADVTGLLHTALSLKMHGHWSLFRQSITEEIMSREIEVHAGACPPEIMMFKQTILLHVMDDGGLTGLDTVLSLLSAANGNWRLVDRLDFYWETAWGPPPDAKSLKKHLADGILQTLASHRPRIWPRHRWTGFKAAVCDVLMLEAVHGLLRPSYQRFLTHLQQQPQAGMESTPRVPQEGDADGQAGQSLATDNEGQAQASKSSTAITVEETDDATASTAPDNFAAAQARHRSQAWRWMQTAPLSRLEVVLMGVVPLQRMMTRHLKNAKSSRVGFKSPAAGALSGVVWLLSLTGKVSLHLSEKFAMMLPMLAVPSNLRIQHKARPDLQTTDNKDFPYWHIVPLCCVRQTSCWFLFAPPRVCADVCVYVYMCKCVCVTICVYM